MAFISGLSSAFGKKLLLFGLRHIDILDKDPAEFVNVDVGKRTTLVVRDVGLHIKKLVALLHLKLPPEIHLATARASLFRITFVLELGPPRIIIEVDGIRIRARLIEDTSTVSKSRGTERTSPRARSPSLHRSSSPPPDHLGGALSDDDDDHIPTVEDLADSFLREEPEEEIKELEQELESQSACLQESVSSNEDDDEESVAGMGAPMPLPYYLRNILNTALDRLQIVVKDIDIDVQDQISSSPLTSEDENAYTSLNFHVDRVAIDSVTAEEPRVNISTSKIPQDTSKLGKRRLRIDNICGRLISDARNFVSASRTSVPSSPVDTRSEMTSSLKTQSEPAASEILPTPEASARLTEAASPVLTSTEGQATALSPVTVPTEDPSHAPTLAPVSPPLQQHPLSSSVHTTDDDRFADANSDDGLERSIASQSSSRSGPRDLGDSSRLYGDDEGLLDFLQNNVLDSHLGTSQLEDDPEFRASDDLWNLNRADSRHGDAQRFYESQYSSCDLPTVSMLRRSIEPVAERASSQESASPSQSITVEQPSAEDDLHHSRQSVGVEAPEPVHDRDLASSTVSQASTQEDLIESRTSSHEDAGSLYMSAMSAAPGQHGHVPGGWDSSSSASSHDTSSDTSVEVPEEMIAGSILRPQPDTDDGCETPRPSSPQSMSSPQQTRRVSTAVPGVSVESQEVPRKLLAKAFLTIDEITVWFPLGLNGDESAVEASNWDLRPEGLAEDSMYETMPGTFSHHAIRDLRKKPAADPAARRRPEPRVPETEKKTATANVSFEIGSIVCHVDFATGNIMFQMLTKAMAALAEDITDKHTQKTTKPETGKLTASRSSVELSVKAVCIAWKERLLSESFTEISGSSPLLEQDPLDAIVKITMASVYGASQTTSTEAQTKVQIAKFTLSSLDYDIITFEKSRSKARRSVSNATDHLKHDVQVVYEQRQDRRVTVITRPVKVIFDLEKVDEALGSFGGFSGVLELSASISSSSRGNSPVMDPAPARTRGVRFGDTTPPPTIAPSTMPKIQVQFGDVDFVLKGQSCAVQLQTTSVKLAVRGSNVRLKVADAQLTGPYTAIITNGAPLVVKIQDTTVNFLSSPEEIDLDKLIYMITPSKDPYENDDDILIETLIRQRKKGSVLRLDVKLVDVLVTEIDALRAFEALGAEMAKLSRITKYLPDDDRPGILTLANVQHIGARVTVNERLGDVSVELNDASVAHIGLPALFATQIGSMSAWREEEVLVHEVVKLVDSDGLPMVMMRVIGDEMEPVMKAKLFNLCAEYHVSTVMAALGLSEDGTIDDIALGLASSVATITGATPPAILTRHTSSVSSPVTTKTKPLHLDVQFRNCALGLNPRKIPAKSLFVLTDAHFLGKQTSKTDYSIEMELRKASIQVIDDISRLAEEQRPAPSSKVLVNNPQLRELLDQGYVTLSSIAAAKVIVAITGDGDVQPQKVDVEFQNELFVIESCADSTQTLIAILNGLQPPMPPSTAERYRPTVPLQEMMESFTMDALAADPDAIPLDEDEDAFTLDEDEEFSMENADLILDDIPTNREFVGSFYNSESLPTEEDMGDSMLEQDDLGALATPPVTRKLGEPAMLESFEERFEVASGQEQLNFDDNYFKDSDSDYKGKARKWDSSNNKYHHVNAFKAPNAPLKVQIHDMNIIWNLYDGYDWPKTRGDLAQAIDDIEARAEERRRRFQEDDEDLEFIEEGQLFNSVWIGVPIKEAKGALAKQVIQDINRGRDGSDQASETGSYATSTATRTTTATARPHSSVSTKRLQKLGRGKHKRISFELKNVAVDLVVFEPGSGETVNSIDVRIQDVVVYDRVPGSTWNKFALCDVEPEKREMNRPMINIALLTVKPAPDLAATELVIEVSVLPLRLHVDQFALEFIQRFFAFKDQSAASSSAPSEQPFIQRLAVNTVKIRLDYKPRKVDYRRLRSGSTTELMNFMTLEDTPILLRHAILYGIKSFDELHDTLNNVWMPDVRENQLAKVLSGVAIARPVVNVGSAVADLFIVPMREYRKDGRVVRAMRKGMVAFTRNTTSEAARLGAKVAIGAQTILETTERFLNPETANPVHPSSSRTPSGGHDWEDLSASDTEEPRAVSNYADQPITVRAGLRSAARHFQKDWAYARDAVIAIPGEIMEEGTGAGMAKVLARRAPTVVLRPLAGTTKAVSRTLLGVGNALDKGARRKIDDVSTSCYDVHE
ncbi:autophagy- protein 2 [Didymosphaeria variabile]|uniref:Autophagy-related protein 2 n=1 Tax=Didymosphaeria variabile TaxID=1932322 RepID=A0A9W8XR71_9PLEO|nr:autophagy- protein 2 [Didymosphaeria variabile]KAJ4357612.1 autophagy- protein 2 [Didymosphaeria variabile]